MNSEIGFNPPLESRRLDSNTLLQIDTLPNGVEVPDGATEKVTITLPTNFSFDIEISNYLHDSTRTSDDYELHIDKDALKASFLTVINQIHEEYPDFDIKNALKNENGEYTYKIFFGTDESSSYADALERFYDNNLSQNGRQMFMYGIANNNGITGYNPNILAPQIFDIVLNKEGNNDTFTRPLEIRGFNTGEVDNIDLNKLISAYQSAILIEEFGESLLSQAFSQKYGIDPNDITTDFVLQYMKAQGVTQLETDGTSGQDTYTVDDIQDLDSSTLRYVFTDYLSLGFSQEYMSSFFENPKDSLLISITNDSDDLRDFYNRMVSSDPSIYNLDADDLITLKSVMGLEYINDPNIANIIQNSRQIDSTQESPLQDSEQANSTNMILGGLGGLGGLVGLGIYLYNRGRKTPIKPKRRL